jgi:hypothetical protein
MKNELEVITSTLKFREVYEFQFVRSTDYNIITMATTNSNKLVALRDPCQPIITLESVKTRVKGKSSRITNVLYFINQTLQNFHHLPSETNSGKYFYRSQRGNFKATFPFKKFIYSHRHSSRLCMQNLHIVLRNSA